MTRRWIAFPHAEKAYAYDAAGLKKHWAHLHRGDCEPWPKEVAVQGAWQAFHRGDFEQAVDVGRKADGSGLHAAIKAQVVYANYLAPEKARLALFEEAAQWAQARREDAPKDANAHYLYAFAIGRYGQGISVAKALAQGFGGKIKEALLTALKLEPAHADAHIAFGAYESEVIEKVGPLVAGVTYGAKRESAIAHYEKALSLNPESAIARIEYANGLLRLFGKTRMDDAERLYVEASKCKPADAMERLDVEFARSEIS